MATTPAFTLGDPNTAGSNVITNNNIKYYAVPANPSTKAAAKWVAIVPGKPGYMNVTVNSSGVPTVQSTTAYSTAAQFNSNKQAAIAAQATAATKVDPTLAAAKAAGFSDAASWQAALKASNAAGFGNDIAKYQAFQYSQSPAGKAEAAAAAQKQLDAQVAATAQAAGLSVADYTAAANKLIAENPAYKNYTINNLPSTTAVSNAIKTQARAIADLAIADKAAQAQGYASAQAKKESENAMNNIATQLKNPISIAQIDDLKKQAAAVGKTIDPASLNTALTAVISNTTSADDLANKIGDAKRLGFTVDSGLINTVINNVTKDVKSLDQIQAFNSNPKLAALGIQVPTALVQQVIKDSATGVKSFDELKALDTKLQGMGQKLDQTLVDSAVDTLSRVSGAATRESLAALQKSAEAAGYKPSVSYIQQQTAAIDKAEADAAAAKKAAEEKAYNDKQAKIASFVAALPQPGSREFNDRALESGSMGYPVKSGDLTYIARVGNQAKNEPARWYVSADGGKTYRTVGSSVDSPTVPGTELSRSYNIDTTANAMIKAGIPAVQVNATIDDVVKNYGSDNTTKFSQALQAASSSPASYESFKQQSIPTALADATKAINDKLSAGGFYNQVWTRDELNSIVQQAKEQGLPINQGLISKVDSAIANREKVLNTTLPAIPANDLKSIGGAGAAAERTYVDGREYIAMPADPVTGKPAGYYTYFYDQNDVQHFASEADYKDYLKTGVVPKTAMDQAQFQNLSNTVNANVKQVETANEMTDWYKTISSPATTKNLSENSSIFRQLTAPDGSTWALKPGDDRAGTSAKWYVSEPGTNTFKPAEPSVEGRNIKSDVAIPATEFKTQYLQQAASNDALVAEKAQAARAAQEAEWNAKGSGFGGLFESDLFKLAAVAAIAWVAAPYVSSWLASAGAEGAAVLSEGSSAAAGLAEAGMGASEIAATLEASGIPTAAADLMAEQAVGIVTGAVDAASVVSASGISAETLAMANATLDPIAALTAAQGWTAVDMAYIASIGVPATVLATAEATNVAMGLPASEIGTAATAEAAGTVPAGTTAEVAASQPVAPPGAETAVTGPAAPAIDTSQMIPTVDAAGNPGFFDPATGQVVNGAGEVVSQAAVPEIGAGTQVAGPGGVGTASGTAGSTTSGIAGDTIFSGQSINPITNAITNAGVTNPILNGALTGAATTGAINLATGQPITTQGLVTGAIGGGVAGGIGGAMGAPTGVFDAALKGAATNVGAGIVVNAVTGQPITADTLAMGAIVGGTIGAGAQVIGSINGNTTYRYDDGSTLTVNSSGAPVSVTDFNGQNVPVAKVLAPVEDRTGTPVAPTAPPAGTIPVQAADGSVLYTDGQNYYTADGQLTDISNPTPGGQTQEAKLSPGNQQIITDATNDYSAGKTTWDEASARINQAVRNDINSGYLTPNGDGTYTAPDGTTYFMNNETGMYDAIAGVPGGTGVGPDTAPVTTTAPQVPVINPGESLNQLPVAPTTTTPPAVPTEVPTTTTPNIPTETGPVIPVPGGVAGGGTTPGTGSGTTPGFGGTSTTGGIGGGGSGGGVGPVDTGIPEIVVTDTRIPPPATPPIYVPPVVTPPAPVAPVQPGPPVVEPPVVEPPVTEPPVEPPPVEPPVEPPVKPTDGTAPGIYVPPFVPPVVPFQYGPIKPLDWGKGVPIGAQGLNPGYITNVPQQYQTQNMQQSKFYWGQKPYQTGGPTGQVFDPNLYQSSPGAPAQPFGLQQMYNPQTQTIENLLQGVRQASAVAPYNMPAAPRV